jgi:hypothetical protein
MNFLITVCYDPGTPKAYLVTDAPNGYDAKDAVMATIGYDPGVPVRVQSAEGLPIPIDVRFVSYELVRDAILRKDIRYND